MPSTWLLLDISQGAGASGRRHLACLTKSPRLPTGFQEMVDIGSWGNPEQSPTYREITYDCDVDWEREASRSPTLLHSNVYCSLPAALGAAEKLSGWAASAPLSGNTALLAREYDIVEGPRNSCWFQVFFPCFYHVHFQQEPSSLWLGHL